MPRLEILRENLLPLKLRDAKTVVGFPCGAGFRSAMPKPNRRGGAFISVQEEHGVPTLVLHQDGGSRSRPIPVGTSPRTVVCGTNAADYPTVLAARREMASWRLLHLEPSAMRTPDPFGGPDTVSESGAHMAATLHRLSLNETSPGQVLAEAASRLSALVPETRRLRLDDDKPRQQRSVQVQMSGSDQWLGPRSMSDGTLRFLALVTMLLDSRSAGVLCMEEPENGMHPARVPSMIDLLRDFAVDPHLPVGEDNPLRQIIVNTHSPDVARQMDLDQLLMVENVDSPSGREARVVAMSDSWRQGMPTVSRQHVADFIGGSRPSEEMGQLSLVFGTAQP